MSGRGEGVGLTFLHVLRFCAFVGGVGTLLISYNFSVVGFGFHLTGYAWLGLFTAGMVTILQFILRYSYNTIGVVLMSLGLASYAYSIATSYVGFWIAGGRANFEADPIGGLVIPLSLAVLFDVAPEFVIYWSIKGESERGGWMNRRLFPQPGGHRPNPFAYPTRPAHPEPLAEKHRARTMDGFAPRRVPIPVHAANGDGDDDE